MMYKDKKIVIFFILVISLLTSCSVPNNIEKNDKNDEITKETVTEKIETTLDTYAMTQRTLTTKLDGIQMYSIQDEKILGVGYVTDVKNRVISYYLTSWEENWRDDWTEQKTLQLPFTTSSYRLHCYGLDMDTTGSVYIILADDSENHIYFLTIDSEGKMIGNLDIVTTLPEGIYISGMSIGSNGKVYLEDSQEEVVYGLDKQGNFIGEYKLEEGNLWGLPKTNDGTVHLVTEKKNQLYVNRPIEGEEILFQSQEQGIQVNQYMDVYEGLENNFFVTTTKGLLSYQLGEEMTTQLVDWSLSGVDYQKIRYVGVMEEEEEQVITILSEIEYGSQTVEVYTFVKSDGSENENRYLILATLGSVDSDLSKQIIAYNKLHPDFPIQTKTYLNNEDGLRQLNTDLLAGNIIDMVNIKSLEQLTSLSYYVEQGLLEDIGAWLESDETVDKTDLLQSILEANKIDGVLYNLVPSFTIETFSGAKSVVGDDFVWTMEEALETMKNYPESSMYAFQSKEDFIYDLCRYNGEYLINEEEGICHFDSEEFIEVLVYASTLPDEIGTIDWRDLVYQKKSLLHQEKELTVNLRSYRDAKGLFKQGLFQDNFSFVGFPSMDESETNGSVFVNIISIAMISTSSNKEVAWQFFQYLLSDSYQKNESLKFNGFPIKKSILRSIMEDQLTNEQNALSGFANSLSGWKIRRGYATQEDIDTMTSFLHSINRLAWENNTIYNIVWEEAQYYFAGECTAEEAAQAMQSRVELYLMEKE